MTTDTRNTLEHWLKVAGVALTLVGLLGGAYQFTRNQAVEAARPFLERKLMWCEDAVEIAAGIAVHGRSSLLTDASTQSPRRVDRFWTLYWGVMGMVENQEITDAMVAFGNGLKSGEATDDATGSLAIAHACRKEMERDWSPVWKR